MKLLKDPTIKEVAKNLMILGGIILACRLSHGAFLAILAIAGMTFVFQRKAGPAVAMFVLFPLLLMVNRSLLPTSAMFALLCRVGVLAIGVAMVLTPLNVHRALKIPLLGLWGYSVWALVSSAGGWMPIISYMKILNFVLFLLGLSFAVVQMQKSNEDLARVRAVFLAISFFMVVGSVFTRLVPSIGFSMVIDRSGIDDMTGFAEYTAQVGTRLFNGMTWHSQGLAPMVAIFSAWTMLDMILVEGRMTLLHMSIIGAAPIILQWTSSRTGLLVFASSLLFIWLYGLPRAEITRQFKGKMTRLFTLFVLLAIAGAVVMEMRGGGISRWLRKTSTEEATKDDRRTLLDAVTASRMGLVELNMDDFERNPMFGMGFQVMSWHKAAYERGQITLYSAPIEKGVMPLMILGETGVIGAAIFIIFLLHFCATTANRRCTATLTLFLGFFISNLSEATFFSPSGTGGIIWCFIAIGGMCVDVIVHRRREARLQMRHGRMPHQPLPFNPF